MIGIRTDANSIIGSGHIMRCMTVAREVINNGEEIVFFVSDHNSDVLLNDKGFRVVCLESHWDQLDTVENIFIKTIKDDSIKCVLVDSYYVTDCYVEQLAKHCKVAYIDDINRSFSRLSLLINYNIYSNKNKYAFVDGKEPRLVLSTKYVPLRPEFRGLPAKVIKETVRNVCLITGGADPKNVMNKMLMYLAPKYYYMRFHVVVGALNRNKDEIHNMKFDNIITYYNANNMHEIMQMCDVAISSSGSVLYELCACGTPTIGYVMADNQSEALSSFSRQGIIIDSGDADNKMFLERLSSNLSELSCESERRKELSYKMKRLVDGWGAKRLAEIICTI